MIKIRAQLRSIIIVLALRAVSAVCALAQVPSQGVGNGLQYYAIENLDFPSNILRGKSTTQGASIPGAGADTLHALDEPPAQQLPPPYGVPFGNIILSPNTRYHLWVLIAGTLQVGDVAFTTPSSGGILRIPDIHVHNISPFDTDGDGLPDLAEFIVGTDPNNPSTRGDGILDGAAVQQGLDPLNGKAVQTGILAAAATPGPAIDVCVMNDIAVTADQAAGVTVFNVFNGMQPKIVGQISTPSPAVAVACDNSRVAAAIGAGGLAVIDISDPPSAKIVSRVLLGGSAQAVTAAAGTAYVGLSSGILAAVDLDSGTVLQRLNLGGPVQDLAIASGILYALTDSSLQVIPLSDDFLSVASSASAPGPAPIPRRRLFVGGGLAYATYIRGYLIFDVSNPAAPALVKDNATSQVGWKQIVANGSGTAIATVGANRSDDGTHDVSVYDVGSDGTATQFVTTFPMPGIASAVSIYNGIGYVACGTAGLVVVNYKAYDSKRIPPSISLTGNFSGEHPQVQEGLSAFVVANVSDDVQVRNVEFYLDDVKVETDGSFPFEYEFVAPRLSAGKTSLSLKARATDTGGNSTWSDTIDVALGPDTRPLRVRGVYPSNGVIVGAANVLVGYFNKTVAQSTLGTAFQLVAAGPDRLFGTKDDVVVNGATLSLGAGGKTAYARFGSNLPPGLYLARFLPSLTDPLGIPLDGLYQWHFAVLGSQDTDQDGLPDDLEIRLGLDPNNPSSLNDGILDGDRVLDGFRDATGKGLTAKWKLFWGYDPLKKDSLGDGIPDALRDPDKDALTNLQEQDASTNPFVADSDGDGWNDEQEVTAGSDPLDPESRPRLTLTSNPIVSALFPQLSPGGSQLAGGVTIGAPLIGVTVLSPLSGSSSWGTTIALPAVSVLTPDSAATFSGPTVGQPPVSVVVPSTLGQLPGLLLGTSLALPPIGVILSAPAASPLVLSTTVAQPPVQILFSSSPKPNFSPKSTILERN